MNPRIPATTPAVRIFEHGDENVLRYGEYPLDPPGPEDVVVRVAAASVSRWDIGYRAGFPTGFRLPGRAAFPLPQQLGREAAGRVIAVGAAVDGFAVGDPVVAVVHPEDPASLEAARGLGNLSPDVALPGHQALGCYAKYLVRHHTMWLPLDPAIDLEQAAVTLWSFATGHRVIRDRLDVRLGDTVLVLGASGGMGTATTQLAALTGATVIAATRSPAKAAGLRELGAQRVLVLDDLDRAAEDLHAITHGRGVDQVADYVGDAAVTAFALGRLRLGGRYCVTVGESSAPLPVTTTDLVRLEMSLLGVRGARRIDAIQALELLAQGRIRTPIAARFPIAKAAEAHRFLEHNTDTVGRVVLVP
ncbi:MULTISPECIES: zinc-binding dehydrogenase [unclassified Nocardia]|uniref:quinone oxidoreductase family protein n=1 Tax=unclassified Nocardia TaxID=2637762 RepID=UPI001CE3E8C3|nr:MULTISPECIES: zinc-binding dehydrogenase [unclassified Nocardia]